MRSLHCSFSRLAFLPSAPISCAFCSSIEYRTPVYRQYVPVSMAAKRKAPARSASTSPPPASRPRLCAPTEAVPAPPPAAGVLKIMSYNVCSLRSMLKTGTLEALVETYRPEVLLLQETKMTDEAVAKLQPKEEDGDEGEREEIPGLPYDVYWAHSTTAKGKHGVATLVLRGSGLDVEKLSAPDDDIVVGEGRVVALRVSCENYGSFALVNAYVPNSGSKLARLEYRCDVFEVAMRSYLQKLGAEYGSVVYSGDLNVAHEEIDIHDSKKNSKSAGHTAEERRAFTEMISSGMVDVYRSKYAHLEGAFTFWSRRSSTTRPQNKGWRLDYFLLNEQMATRVDDIIHLRHIDASDHCPIMCLLSPVPE